MALHRNLISTDGGTDILDGEEYSLMMCEISRD